MGNMLGMCVFPDSSQADLDHELETIWAIVKKALKKSEGLPESLIATFDQFNANIERQGKSEFYTLLREIAERKSWSDLTVTGMYLDRLLRFTS